MVRNHLYSQDRVNIIKIYYLPLGIDFSQTISYLPLVLCCFVWFITTLCEPEILTLCLYKIELINFQECVLFSGGKSAQSFQFRDHQWDNIHTLFIFHGNNCYTPSPPLDNIIVNNYNTDCSANELQFLPITFTSMLVLRLYSQIPHTGKEQQYLDLNNVFLSS